MSVLLDGSPATRNVAEGQSRPQVRPRRPGETRRPPTRARVVAGRGRAPASTCTPRRIVPRWPWLAAIALVVGLAVTGLGVFAHGMSAAVPERTATVTVVDGQTLSDLARLYAPEADSGAVVARIKQLNDLGDGTVVPGLPLTVPVDATPLGAGR